MLSSVKVENVTTVYVIRQSWVRHCSLLRLSHIVLYFVRFQLMRSLPVSEIVQFGLQWWRRRITWYPCSIQLVIVVSFTVHVYMIDVELSPINGVFVYVCAHVQVLSWVQCVCVCVCAVLLCGWVSMSISCSRPSGCIAVWLECGPPNMGVGSYKGMPTSEEGLISVHSLTVYNCACGWQDSIVYPGWQAVPFCVCLYCMWCVAVSALGDCPVHTYVSR